MDKVVRILIIEDDEDVSELLEVQAKAFCDSYDLRSIVTRSLCGEDGLKELNEEKFDLIILDLRLPDIHGSKILSYKVKELKNATPTIVLSGNISEHGDSGSPDVVFLQKPIAPDRLETYFKVLLRPLIMPTPQADSGTWNEVS